VIEVLGSGILFLIILALAIAVQHREGKIMDARDRALDSKVRRVERVSTSVVQKLKNSSGNFPPAGKRS
jgi:hypothetical protein